MPSGALSTTLRHASADHPLDGSLPGIKGMLERSDPDKIVPVCLHPPGKALIKTMQVLDHQGAGALAVKGEDQSSIAAHLAAQGARGFDVEKTSVQQLSAGTAHDRSIR